MFQICADMSQSGSHKHQCKGFYLPKVHTKKMWSVWSGVSGFMFKWESKIINMHICGCGMGRETIRVCERALSSTGVPLMAFPLPKGTMERRLTSSIKHTHIHTQCTWAGVITSQNKWNTINLISLRISQLWAHSVSEGFYSCLLVASIPLAHWWLKRCVIILCWFTGTNDNFYNAFFVLTLLTKLIFYYLHLHININITKT